MSASPLSLEPKAEGIKGREALLLLINITKECGADER